MYAAARRPALLILVATTLQTNPVGAIRLARQAVDSASTANDDAPDAGASSEQCIDDMNQQEGQEYFVDNSVLRAKTKGMGYRFSKDLTNVDRAHFALWGTIVRGSEESDGWLKVGLCYLPMSLKGTKVLVPNSSQSRLADPTAEDSQMNPNPNPNPTSSASDAAPKQETAGPARSAGSPVAGEMDSAPAAAQADAEAPEASAPTTVTNSRQCSRGDAAAVPPAVSGAVPHLVDNSKLQASTKGMGYRFSKDMRDIDKTSMSTWGTTVLGIDSGDGWLQVGDCFLPMKMKGIQVLTPVRATTAAGSDSALQNSSEASQQLATQESNISKAPSTHSQAVPEILTAPTKATAAPQDSEVVLDEGGSEVQQNRTDETTQPDSHTVHNEVLDRSATGCQESLHEKETRIANLMEVLAKVQVNTTELRQLLNASETAGAMTAKRLDALQASILEGEATLSKLVRSLAEELRNQTTFMRVTHPAQKPEEPVAQDALPAGAAQLLPEAAAANSTKDPIEIFALLSRELENLTRQATSSGAATAAYVQALRQQLEAEQEAKRNLTDQQAAETVKYAKEKSALEQELEAMKRNASEIAALRDTATSQVMQLKQQLASLQAVHQTDNVTALLNQQQKEAAEARQRLADLQERLAEEIS